MADIKGFPRLEWPTQRIIHSYMASSTSAGIGEAMVAAEAEISDNYPECVFREWQHLTINFPALYGVADMLILESDEAYQHRYEQRLKASQKRLKKAGLTQPVLKKALGKVTGALEKLEAK